MLAQVPAYVGPADRDLTVVTTLDPAYQRAAETELAALLDDEGAAYDIASHRSAPSGLRIWAGATVETADLEALGPWLDWAWAALKAEGGDDG
mgnify:CR=1 FL=1